MISRTAFRAVLRARPFAALAALLPVAAFAQTQWHKLPGNPVLSPGPPGSWDQTTALVVTVLHHQGLHKMWYQGDVGFGYATSQDGVTWMKSPANPVLQPGPPGSWDEDEHSPGGGASVVIVGGTYHMFYGANDAMHDGRIGHATSPDGIAWTKDPANPVIGIDSPGPWDTNEAFDPSVIFRNGQFQMWYIGNDGSTQRILYATSPDGTAWMRYTSAFMLENGPPGSWDDGELTLPCVLFAGGAYHMWYTAWNAAGRFAIGYARSPDGIAWTKNLANPVLASAGPGSWDQLVAGSVVTCVDSLVMYYGGLNYPTWPAGPGALFQTGYAVSSLVSGLDFGQAAVLSAAIQRVTPNPFTPRTTIEYALAEAGPVRLGVYDVAGRLVRMLVDASRETGRYATLWNGMDERGVAAVPGVYLVRLETAGKVTSRKAVLAK